MTSLIVATRPDRTEVGRLVHGLGAGGQVGWAIVGADGRPWGSAAPWGAAGVDGRRLSLVAPGDAGGWHMTVDGGPPEEPLRTLVVAAAVVADVL